MWDELLPQLVGVRNIIKNNPKVLGLEGAGAGLSPILLFILDVYDTAPMTLLGPAHSTEKPVKGPCCNHQDTDGDRLR